MTNTQIGKKRKINKLISRLEGFEGLLILMFSRNTIFRFINNLNDYGKTVDNRHMSLFITDKIKILLDLLNH